MKHRPLNSRQQTFADFTLSGIPAGRAWEKAGYQASGAAADANAFRALQSPAIKAYISQERVRKDRENRALREEAIAFLVDVIRTPVADLDASSPLTKEITREEMDGEVIRTTVCAHDKIEAAKVLSRIMGWNSIRLRADLPAASPESRALVLEYTQAPQEVRQRVNKALCETRHVHAPPRKP